CIILDASAALNWYQGPFTAAVGNESNRYGHGIGEVEYGPSGFCPSPPLRARSYSLRLKASESARRTRSSCIVGFFIWNWNPLTFAPRDRGNVWPMTVSPCSWTIEARSWPSRAW